jgi:hypothetical protein
MNPTEKALGLTQIYVEGIDKSIRDYERANRPLPQVPDGLKKSPVIIELIGDQNNP